jgi:hypothetical protein
MKRSMNMTLSTGRRGLLAGAGLLAGGAVVGAILAGTFSASAATPSPTSPSGASTQGGPGVQENDGIPESQEHHGGAALNLTGTVSAIGGDSVTIKTSTGTTTYKVDSNSDIDKNGEAKLSSLVAGDAVRYSVRSGTTTIDRLHAGDEAKDFPGFNHAAPSGGAA